MPVIYRGPTDRQPRTVNKPVAGAYLPGSFVEETATQLSQLATATAKRPMILGNAEFAGQDTATAYTSGSTGVAYELEPGQVYQARMAAGTYAKNAPLTIGASGRLQAAAAASIVVAWYDGPTTALTADTLADVIVANSYTAA